MKVLHPAFSKSFVPFVKGQSLREMAEKTRHLYAKENLIYSVHRDGGKNTSFDLKLESKWAECVDQELFRYQVEWRSLLSVRVLVPLLSADSALRACFRGPRQIRVFLIETSHVRIPPMKSDHRPR